MEISNSYIFMSNQHRENNNYNKENDTIIISTTSVSHYIEKAFNMRKNSDNEFEVFKNNYSFNYKFDDVDFDVAVVIHIVGDNTYVTVSVNSSNKTRCIKCMENLHCLLEESDLHKDFIMIISYDAVSEYYCNKIYSKLNELERNLRKLLFNIYTLNFGREYHTTTTSIELQKKIKENMKISGSTSKKEIERIKKFFYSMTFSDVQQLLFDERWTKIEEKYKANFLSKNANLSELSDEDLRNAFISMQPKSDWDRFFKEKLEDTDVKNLLNSIRESRNSIAHCKFLYKEDFELTREKIQLLNTSIVNAIQITEEKDFSDKNDETIRLSMESIARVFEGYREQMEQITMGIVNAMTRFSEMITPISEMTAYFFNGLNNFGEMMSPLLKEFSQYSALDELEDEVEQCLDKNEEDEEDKING